MTTPAEQAADELIADVRDMAAFVIDAVLTAQQETLTATERELVGIGVEAGYTATIVVLQRRGLLPGADPGHPA